METTAIKTTTDYSIFKGVWGNRELNAANFKRILKSVENRNLLRYIPIVVNEQREVIDGQHRLAVCKTLGLPVYYVVGVGLDIKDVHRMNENVKTWTLNDYLESYADQSIEDYAYMRGFINRYNLPLNISLMLLAGSSGGECISKFKAGQLKIKHATRANRIAGFLKSIKKHESYTTRAFISAILTIIEKCADSSRLADILNNGVKRCSSRVEYLQVIQDAYNKGLAKKNRKLFIDI